MNEWPASLRIVLQTILSLHHPMFLYWGPELIQFYNDAYRPSFGDGKHPAAMGQQGQECWAEAWSVIEPQLEEVIETGKPTWHDDALVPIERNGRMEEVYWSYGFSAVYSDDGEINGVLVVCTETTAGVLANRRLRLTATMAERAGLSKTPAGVLERAVGCFTEQRSDIPLAGVIDDGRVTHTSGLEDTEKQTLKLFVAKLAGVDSPTRIELDAPIAAAPWPEPVTDLFLVPMGERATLLYGLSPRLPFDDTYRDFLLQLTDSVGAARQRVEAIARRISIESERQDLLMQAPVATAILVGPEHRFELANRLYVEMVDREVTGKTYLEAFPELTGAPVVESLDRAYREGVPFATDEMLIRIVPDNGSAPQDRHYKFNLQPIRTADGETYALMVVAVDITEMVRSRQAQARAHEELQKAHDERTELIEKLESANRAKDEFLAVLGHELRNPLAPIVTALELVRMKNDGVLPREHQLMERQVKHLVRLVDDLLDVARITRGKVELKEQTCKIGEVVSKAIEMADPLFEKRRHRLTVDVPQSISWWGDPTRLAQVVANLLTNAARYTAPGGDVRVVATANDGEIRIAVSDNGIGIEPELLEDIFTMFVQSVADDERAAGGLGLGLTLVKSLVELHGGAVTAHSEGLGRGSTFEVRLPVNKTRIADPDSGPMPALAATRVLVVDDNVDAAQMMAQALRSRGHIVKVAHDGPSALDALNHFTPQCAVLDIGLPVMDGYELASKITERIGPKVCYIAVTGYGQAHDRERSTQAGFAAHLVKPVRFEELAAAIAQSCMISDS